MPAMQGPIPQSPSSFQQPPQHQVQSGPTSVHIPNCAQPISNSSSADNAMPTQVGPTSTTANMISVGSLDPSQNGQQQSQQQVPMGQTLDQAQGAGPGSIVMPGQMSIPVPGEFFLN